MRALALALLIACGGPSAPEPAPAAAPAPVETTAAEATPEDAGEPAGEEASTGEETPAEEPPADAEAPADAEVPADAEAAPTTAEPPAPEQAAAPPTDLPDGASCLAASECASGLCEGQGCTDDAPGTCVSRQRACTRDRRPFCGCRGMTFHSSSSCVGRRYAHAGPCPGSEDPTGRAP